MKRLSIGCVIASLTIACALFLAVAAPGASLVQYWPLEETGSATATNAIAGGNLARIMNQSPATAWGSGFAVRSTASVSLDNATPDGMFQDYLDLGTLGLTEATVSMWLNPDLVAGTNGLITPVTDFGGYGGSFRFNPIGGTNSIIGNTTPQLGMGSIIANGGWSHLALVYSHGTCTLYVNGDSIATNYSDFNYITARLGLGARQPKYVFLPNMTGSASYYTNLLGLNYKGLVDDISIWNGPVSSNTIAALAAGQVPTSITDGPEPAEVGAHLLQYYPLEETAGSDSAANLAGASPGYLTNFDTGTCWVANTAGTTNTPIQLTNSTTALAFDGVDDFVNLGVMNFMGRGSVSMWVNPRVFPPLSPVNLMNFFAQIDGDVLQPGRIALDQVGVIRVGVGKSQFSLVANLTAENAVPTNVWTHLVFCYDNGYVTAYVNGTKTVTARALLGFSVAQFGIGAIFADNPNYGINFDGMMDDISLWDRPLSSISIAKLAAGVCPTNIVDSPNPNCELSLAFQTNAAPYLTNYWTLESPPGSDVEASQVMGGDDASLLNFLDLNACWVTNDLAPVLTNRSSNKSTTALYFDGVNNNCLNMNDHIKFVGSPRTPNGTISLWIKATALDGDRRIFGQRQSSPTSSIGFIGLTPAGQVWSFDGVSTLGGGYMYTGPEYGTIATNQWYHLAFTYANGLTTLYVNGVKKQTVAQGLTTSIPSIVNQGFGNKTKSSLGEPFAGYMDDISIWTGALSDASVAQLASGVSPTAITNKARTQIVLSWPASYTRARLERAPSLSGPWTTVTANLIGGQTSPIPTATTYTARVDYDPSTPAQFFRLRL